MKSFILLNIIVILKLKQSRFTKLSEQLNHVREPTKLIHLSINAAAGQAQALYVHYSRGSECGLKVLYLQINKEKTPISLIRQLLPYYYPNKGNKAIKILFIKMCMLKTTSASK